MAINYFTTELTVVFMSAYWLTVR